VRSPAAILARDALAGGRSGHLELAWLDAADDAHGAYLAWCQADRADAADAFAVYRAALDREEAAAGALRLLSTRRP